MPGDCVMPIEIIQGLLIPLAGTSLGTACVFFIRGEHSHIGTLSFAAGFSLMMVLDVAL